MRKIMEKLTDIAVDWAKAFVESHIVKDGGIIHVSEPDRIDRAMSFIAQHS